MAAQWDAEVKVDEALVVQLLASRFPEFAGRPCRRIGEGWDCSAWLVDDEWVFRIPRRQLGADCLANEIRVLPSVADRLPSPVSTSVFVGQPTDGYPWVFAACRLILGESACDADLTDQQTVLLAGQLGSFLRALHAFGADEAATLGAMPDTYARLESSRRCSKAREAMTQAAESGLLSTTDELCRVIEEIEDRQPRPRTHCLVHGDLCSRHVMTEPGRLTGVIDWGDIHVGDPAVDLAVGWSMFAADARSEFCAAYGPMDRNTRDLAVMRAIGHSLSCLLYAGDVNDRQLRLESQKALQRAICE
jgi:aminoglycoside phosphotransferase (APT) family kinase protein